MGAPADNPPGRWWLVVAGLSLACAVAVLIHPIQRTPIGPWTVTAKDPSRPLALALITAGWFVFRRPLLTQKLERLVGHSASWLALLMAVIVAIAGFTYGSTAAGGTDSYGYISQADLWLSGRTSIPIPWAAEAPWPDALETFSPLGYRPAPHAWAILPVMFPGLPLLMAAVKAVFGHCGVFGVAPVSGALLVLATYGIGGRIGRPVVGLGAAWLVATSPIALFMAMNPMADLPAAAAWAGATFFVLGNSRQNAAAAGLAIALGVLIRPNVVTLLPVFVAWTVWRDTEARRWSRPLATHTLWLLVTALIGPAAIGIINAIIYGSPVLSGYGNPNFSSRNIWRNIVQHLGWIRQSETSVIFLGILALLPRRILWNQPGAGAFRWFFIGSVIAVWIPYLFLSSSDTWWYLRYLLPIWPIVMIGMAVTVAAVYGAGGPYGKIAAIVVILLLGTYRLHRGEDLGVFQIGAGERKYTEVAREVRRLTAPDSVILSILHSGSVRYYAGRMTVLWKMGPGSLDKAVNWFAARGNHPYLLVEDFEEQELRGLSGATDAVARATRVPLVIWQSGQNLHIYLYDLLETTPAGGRLPEVIDLTAARREWCMLPAPAPTLERPQSNGATRRP